MRAIVAELVADDVEGEAGPIQLPRVQAIVHRRVVLELLVLVHAVHAGAPHLRALDGAVVHPVGFGFRGVPRGQRGVGEATWSGRTTT